jgi:hypothetical protein
MPASLYIYVRLCVFTYRDIYHSSLGTLIDTQTHTRARAHTHTRTHTHTHTHTDTATHTHTHTQPAAHTHRYAFPGIGLAASVAGVTEITDKMM